MKDLQTSAHAPSLTLDILITYLEGKLSETEAKRVDDILKVEPEWIDVLENLEMGLAHDPDLRQTTAGLTQAASEAAFRASAQEATAPTATATKAKTISLPLWRQPIWQMAAVIAVLLLPLGWFLAQNGSSHIDKMAEVYLQPLSVSGGVRGDGPSAFEILEKGLATYQRGDYALAAHDLAFITNSQDLNTDQRLTATMYLGLSYLFSNEPVSAGVELTKVVEAGNSPYLTEAKWYLAWSYWKAGDIEKAKTGFEELANIPGLHKEPAQKILEAWK